MVSQEEIKFETCLFIYKNFNVQFITDANVKFILNDNKYKVGLL